MIFQKSLVPLLPINCVINWFMTYLSIWYPQVQEFPKRLTDDVSPKQKQIMCRKLKKAKVQKLFGSISASLF